MGDLRLPRVLIVGVFSGALLLLLLYAVARAAGPLRVEDPRVQGTQPIVSPSSALWNDSSADVISVAPPDAQLFQGVSGSGLAALEWSCRYGVSAFGSAEAAWLPVLHAGWYHDFSAHKMTPMNGIEYVQVLRVRQNKDGCTYLDGYSINPPLTEVGLGAVVRSHLGALWVVGNEPDRGPNPDDCLGTAQDDTYPEVYARAYHDAYYFIKQRDPSAQLALAGLVEVTPGRLQYLDKVWARYQQLYGATMPVDVWNMHLYVLPEAYVDGQPNGIANVALGTDTSLAIRESGNDPAQCAESDVYCWAEHDSLSIFSEQVVAMRTWMKDHGQRNRPLYLSEYSILYPFQDFDDPVNPTRCFLQDEYGKCFTQARVTEFLTRTFAYLESAKDADLGYPRDQNRLVQRWLWYTMYTRGVGYVSNLVTANISGLTGLGQIFADQFGKYSHYVNVMPDPIPPSSAFLSHAGGTVDVTLQAYVRNEGDIQTSAPFTVTVYSDSALTQPIGSVSIALGMGGCGRSRSTVNVVWQGLTAGQHPFWVKVDSTSAIVESDETDNVTSGLVNVVSSGMFLPHILRR